jgi:general secretion pathway protein H
MRSDPGFTLLELTVVLVLLAAAFLLAVPRLGPLLHPDVERDVRMELENLILALRNEAALSGGSMLVVIDLEEGVMASASLGSNGEVNQEEVSPRLRRRIPKNLRFMDVIVPREGKVSQGTTYLEIRPNGWVDPVILHLRDADGKAFSLLVDPIGGTVRLKEGYVERRSLPL